MVSRCSSRSRATPAADRDDGPAGSFGSDHDRGEAQGVRAIDDELRANRFAIAAVNAGTVRFEISAMSCVSGASSMRGGLLYTSKPSIEGSDPNTATSRYKARAGSTLQRPKLGVPGPASPFHSDVPKSPARLPPNSAVGHPEPTSPRAFPARGADVTACTERGLWRSSAVSRVVGKRGVHSPGRAAARRSRGGVRRRSRQVAHKERLSIQRER